MENLSCKSLKFTLFSDLHYKKGMYPATVSDLRKILDRADATESDFILSAGDMWNDLGGSPELRNTYFCHFSPNGELLPAYNIYGNHELESDTMEFVNAFLTNDRNVIWGSEDGTYQSDIGYYYFEKNGFRIICLDSQYSYQPQRDEYEHSHAYSWGAPEGNLYEGSLGPKQLEWLESVLNDAALKGRTCIVVSHHGVSDLFLSTCPDRKKIREIFKKANTLKAGTVLMAINGHEHTSHCGFFEDVFYLEINTVLNGNNVDHRVEYGDEHVYRYEEYDDSGNLKNTYMQSYNALSWKRCYYFNSPLCAVVTVTDTGTITVEGSETDWAYGIVPENPIDGKMPRTVSGIFKKESVLSKRKNLCCKQK